MSDIRGGTIGSGTLTIGTISSAYSYDGTFTQTLDKATSATNGSNTGITVGPVSGSESNSNTTTTYTYVTDFCGKATVDGSTVNDCWQDVPTAVFKPKF